MIFIRLKYIKEFNKSDRRALTALAKTSIATEQHLQTMINKNRIYSYIKEGILKKDMYYNPVPTKSIQAYRLTQHGQKIATYYFNLKDFQHAESIIHDIIIANKYFSLSQKEQKTWISETTIKKILQEKEDEFEEGKEYGAVDGVYKDLNGNWIGFEGTTSSYRNKDITKKKNTSRLLNLKYEEGRR
ncbi:hypothetical protein [Clostridium sp. ZBS2]|uniref:hypothetical protein n=1 Tax=Clostridium sp. ZBS2 TaxID=2949976 RepID=UPI002079365A|nr:hypothetical protein [Clostridium sp. ZBS2]